MVDIISGIAYHNFYRASLGFESHWPSFVTALLLGALKFSATTSRVSSLVIVAADDQCATEKQILEPSEATGQHIGAPSL